jgi:hypothetical protein
MELNKSENEIDLSGENFKDGKEKIHPCFEKQLVKNIKSFETLSHIKPLKSPLICYVPESILILLRSIEKNMTKSLEFGIFVHGDLNHSMDLILTEKFYVPKQTVTPVSIDFKEEVDKKIFNGVIHRHPSMCNNFSGTDDDHINSNFDFSLLYVNNNITRGVLNLELKDHLRIQIPLEIKILYPVSYDVTNLITKIEEQKESMELFLHKDNMSSSTESLNEYLDNSDILFPDEF